MQYPGEKRQACDGTNVFLRNSHTSSSSEHQPADVTSNSGSRISSSFHHVFSIKAIYLTFLHSYWTRSGRLLCTNGSLLPAFSTAWEKKHVARMQRSWQDCQKQQKVSHCRHLARENAGNFNMASARPGAANMVNHEWVMTLAKIRIFAHPISLIQWLREDARGYRNWWKKVGILLVPNVERKVSCTECKHSIVRIGDIRKKKIPLKYQHCWRIILLPIISI